MKKNLFYLSMLSMLLFFSCNKSQKNIEPTIPIEPIVVHPEPVEEIVPKPEPTPTPQPKPVPEPPVAPKPVIKPPEKKKTPKPALKPEEKVVATFGDVKITQKDYIDTKSEIEIVVEELNEITETENYKRWLNYLSQEYLNYFSKPAILKSVSEQLPIKGIRLTSLKDYFKYVFVPSRKDIRVDDIKFTSPKTVNVIMRNNNARLLIYSLEKQDENWKLVRSR